MKHLFILPVISAFISMNAQAACRNGVGILCESYDIQVPLNISLTGATTPAMTIMGGKAGIGTLTPAHTLSVVGTIQSTTGGFVFPDGSVQTTAASGGGGSVSPTTTVHTTNGTWTKPNQGHFAIIEVWGAGGGGGRANSTSCTGGAGGGYSQTTYLLQELPSTVALTIGEGGVGKISTSGNGTSGTATSFGELLSAPGGGGGYATASISYGGVGNETGGSSSSFSNGINTGRAGGSGGAVNQNNLRAAGNSIVSLGHGGASNVTINADHGLTPGGGGGCSVGFDAGNGGNGQIRITVY